MTANGVTYPSPYYASNLEHTFGYHGEGLRGLTKAAIKDNIVKLYKSGGLAAKVKESVDFGPINALMAYLDERLLNNSEVLTVLDGVIDDAIALRISKLPCTRFIDEIGFGDPKKPGTVEDAGNSIITYMFWKKFDPKDDPFMQDVLRRIKNGEVIDQVLCFAVPKILDVLGMEILPLLANVDIEIVNRALQATLGTLNLPLLLLLALVPGTKNTISTTLYDFAVGAVTSQSPTGSGTDALLVYDGPAAVPTGPATFRLPYDLSVNIGNWGRSAEITWYTKASLTSPGLKITDQSGSLIEGIRVTYSSEPVEITVGELDLGIARMAGYRMKAMRRTARVEGLELFKPYKFAAGDSKTGWWAASQKLEPTDRKEERMEAYVKEQILATLKYAPFHMAAGYFKKSTSPAVEECRRKLGGSIKGVCHPGENYAQIKGAGIGWFRLDVPFPFEKDGGARQDYLKWKEKLRHHRENGIKIMALTPYPGDYFKAGIDPRTPEGETRVREIAAFLIHDLKGLVGGFQITNEMGIPHFTLPLTMRQAARFIGVQLEAMHPLRADILIGYNSAGPQCDLHGLLRPWFKYCDYVGIDIYIGCFFGVACWMGLFDAMLRYLWSMTGKPIILIEFGYISDGTPKIPEEKHAVLQRYGMNSEKEAREKLDLFMENIKKVNEEVWRRVTKNASGSYADYIFKSAYKNHFYSELPKRTVIKKYPHTPEGQAAFYRDIYPRLAKLPFLLGAFIYCWQDGEKCGYCNQADCPTETRWGLVDMNGNEKPAYFAVQDALKKL